MNNTNQNTNKNQNELGALWKKKSKAGMSFLSGYINDHDGQRIDVVVFANSKKTNEKAPDYRLYISKPLENKQAPVATSTATKQNVQKKVVEQVQEDEDDIL
jgi:uncharacterized protein (DUF736 family)